MKPYAASKQISRVCIAVLSLTGLCFSQPIIRLSSGPPTTNVLVSGSGFAASSAIDVYFDLMIKRAGQR